MLKIGVIGGSGLENVTGIEPIGEVTVETSYGEPSSPFKHYKTQDAEYFLLSRHGVNHHLQPSQVNYAANVDAFKKLGVDCVISFSSVGGINPRYTSSSLVLIDNAMDFTSGRERTLFNTTDKGVYHVDLTYPFCDNVRRSIISSCKKLSIELDSTGIYVCTNGPRLETAAEIKAYGMLGADVVGMTLFPEVAMFREAEICYSCVGVVVNAAAGISNVRLTADEIIEEGRKVMDKVRQLIIEFPKHYADCTTGCKTALSGAKL